MKIKMILQQKQTNFKNEAWCRHWVMPWLLLFIGIPAFLSVSVILAMIGIWSVNVLFGFL